MPFYTVTLKVEVVVHDDSPSRAETQAFAHGEKIIRSNMMQNLLRIISAGNATEKK